MIKKNWGREANGVSLAGLSFKPSDYLSLLYHACLNLSNYIFIILFDHILVMRIYA